MQLPFYKKLYNTFEYMSLFFLEYPPPALWYAHQLKFTRMLRQLLNRPFGRGKVWIAVMNQHADGEPGEALAYG